MEGLISSPLELMQVFPCTVVDFISDLKYLIHALPIAFNRSPGCTAPLSLLSYLRFRFLGTKKTFMCESSLPVLYQTLKSRLYFKWKMSLKITNNNNNKIIMVI